MIKSLLPTEVRVIITIYDIRLGSNLTTKKTKQFTKNSFLYTILGFTQSHSGPLNDRLQKFVQKFRVHMKARN